ncbi:hypothetical protein MASR2M117_13370 [Paludibacter sp.]
MKVNHLIRILVLITSVAFFMACEKDPAAGLAKSKTMMINANIYNPNKDTKSVWIEGDKLKIVSDTDFTGQEFTVKNGGEVKAVLVGKIVEGSQYYGVFPYNEADALQEDARLSVTFPTKQPANYWPMVGVGTKTHGLNFIGIGALLVLNVSGQGTVASVKVEGTDSDGNTAILSGASKINMEQSTPHIESFENGEAYVEKDLNLTLDSEGKQIQIVIPTNNYNLIKITLTSVADETYAQEEASINLLAEQSAEIDLNVDFSKAAQTSEPNLSIAGLANCYVVPMEGNYFFSTTLSDNTVLTGTNADILWSELEYEWAGDNSEIISAKSPDNAGYIIKNVTYNPTENTISFTATGNLGNAVIALYTDVADVKTIVWSWHIWVAGKSIDEMGIDWVSKNLAAKSQKLTWLDRNIGAISIQADHVGSYGALYQWGRKDPFIGSRIIGKKSNPSGTDETDPFGEYTIPVYTNKALSTGFALSSTSLTVNEVAKDPMAFYVASGNWASDIQASAWGDGVAPFTTWQTYMKGIDPNTNYTDGVRKGSKSIYDPCPPGYRVPTCEEMWLSFAAWQNDDYPAWLGNVTSQLAAKTNSHIVTAYDDPSKTILFPAFGHRDQGKLDALGSAGYYLTSTINPENLSYAFRQLVGTNMRVEGSGSFVMARPVRCVAE